MNGARIGDVEEEFAIHTPNALIPDCTTGHTRARIRGNDHGPGNADHRHKPFAVKECQGIRQLPEIVVAVIDHASGKTGNDAHEHPHVQRGSSQHGSEVSVYQDFLAKQRVGNRIRIAEHSGGHPENGTGDLVDQDKGNDCREGTACPFLCPGAANRNRKQNVQVIDHGPADVLHRASQSSSARRDPLPPSEPAFQG